MSDDLERSLNGLQSRSPEPPAEFLGRVAKRRWSRRARMVGAIAAVIAASVVLISALRPESGPDADRRPQHAGTHRGAVPAPAWSRPVGVAGAAAMIDLRGLDDVEGLTEVNRGNGAAPSLAVPTLRAFEVDRVDEL